MESTPEEVKEFFGFDDEGLYYFYTKGAGCEEKFESVCSEE